MPSGKRRRDPFRVVAHAAACPRAASSSAYGRMRWTWPTYGGATKRNGSRGGEPLDGVRRGASRPPPRGATADGLGPLAEGRLGSTRRTASRSSAGAAGRSGRARRPAATDLRRDQPAFERVGGEHERAPSDERLADGVVAAVADDGVDLAIISSCGTQARTRTLGGGCRGRLRRGDHDRPAAARRRAPRMRSRRSGCRRGRRSCPASRIRAVPVPQLCQGKSRRRPVCASSRAGRRSVRGRIGPSPASSGSKTTRTSPARGRPPVPAPDLPRGRGAARRSSSQPRPPTAPRPGSSAGASRRTSPTAVTAAGRAGDGAGDRVLVGDEGVRLEAFNARSTAGAMSRASGKATSTRTPQRLPDAAADRFAERLQSAAASGASYRAPRRERRVGRVLD